MSEGQIFDKKLSNIFCKKFQNFLQTYVDYNNVRLQEIKPEQIYLFIQR